MITVKLTHADLQRGKKWSNDRDPWCLAIARDFPGRKVRVGYNFASVDDQLYHLTPAEAKLVLAFETGEYIEPHEFTLTEVAK